MSIDQSYNNFVGFRITEVEDSDTGTPPITPIEFEWENPSVGMDAGSTFVEHQIIGGALVRQRIGDKPIELSVSGVCKERVAHALMRLRNVKNATVQYDGLPGDSMRVHVASMSVDPMSEGGSVQLSDAEEQLYTYDLNLVEILNSGSFFAEPDFPANPL